MPEERRDLDKRPSPEALLEAARREEGQGRLKIFLGAAPGVGKTYEMLQSALARRREGVDVVVGVVETHGRAETQALLQGLEIVPRRRIDYKGRILEEMDLDAILARRPKLALVDELAHTNAPGSRHPKRYLDVEELLAAGIDVYTTVNIQHLESLNDVVAQITHIRVRETVPDSVIDRADDVEVIDLTPDDLIERLKAGKVYVPETAKRAVERYFSPGNLTALRELALRRTAQRVDEQLLTHMQAHAIPGPWAAGERVLVVVNEDPKAAALVRYARRVAERLKAPWTALYVETTRALRLTESERDRIAQALRLAQSLDGEAVTIPGSNQLANEIIGYAQANNFTHLVIGKSKRSRLYEKLFGSVTAEIVRSSGNIAVHVIAGEEHQAVPAKTVPAKPRGEGFDVGPYLTSTVLPVVALAAALVLQRFLDIENIALVFLTGVLASAVMNGLWPALYASVVSILLYNFFFLPPLYTFTIADPENVVALFFFLVVAVIASNLTGRVHDQALTARQRAKTTEDLYLFSRKLAGVVSMDDLLWATAFQIASMLKVRVVLLLPEGGSIALRAGYPPEDIVDEADLAAAKWAWEKDHTAGRGSDTLPGAKWLFIPMRTARGPVGVVGIDSDKPGPLLTPEQRRLLDALIDQAALAIERVALVEDLDRARLSAESDRLRSALLTSISHDLRTPLASILGAAGSLANYPHLLDDAARRELTLTIEEESERLNRFIGNLLDMSRLEFGGLAPNASLVDLGEIVGSAIERATKILVHHRVEVEIAADLPMLRLDPVLFEQVLFNLLDNASRYSPEGSAIRLLSWRDGPNVVLQVLDEGVGIPAEDVERIFDKFYRVRKVDTQRAGTGLGLSICRGFVEAMHGTIVASNRRDRSGALFTINLPVPAADNADASASAGPQGATAA
jgi:two-component system sensor histidine kinase KdpD